MVYKKFRYNLVIRVLLLALTIFVLFWLADMGQYYITPVLLGLLLIGQVYSIILYVERTNRELTNFLESIRYADFTRSFKVEGLGASFDELKSAFNDVIEDFRKIRTEKEEHYFYLQNIIRHIDVSIVAYQEDGTIEMVNDAAKKLFQIYHLKKVNAISAWNAEVADLLLTIGTGEKRLIKVKEADAILQLSIFATEFKLNDRTIKLVSLKNIQSELEEQEMEAWQKLIRVLTHEIMNSIAPIASLTSTVNVMVRNVADTIEESLPADFNRETIDDIQSALETIHKRSTGLIHFVETYRNLTRIPKPNFTIFVVNDLITNIHGLLNEELRRKNITMLTDIAPADLRLTADEQLIEQVIINLMKNSIHALEGQAGAHISVSAFKNKRGHVVIQVHDNGRGIIKEVLDKIFIPFFTTKPTGSGIGLSLSRQILRMHGGNIAVKSDPEITTCFTLTF